MRVLLLVALVIPLQNLLAEHTERSDDSTNPRHAVAQEAKSQEEFKHLESRLGGYHRKSAEGTWAGAKIQDIGPEIQDDICPKDIAFVKGLGKGFQVILAKPDGQPKYKGQNDWLNAIDDRQGPYPKLKWQFRDVNGKAETAYQNEQVDPWFFNPSRKVPNFGGRRDTFQSFTRNGDLVQRMESQPYVFGFFDKGKKEFAEYILHWEEKDGKTELHMIQEINGKFERKCIYEK